MLLKPYNIGLSMKSNFPINENLLDQFFLIDESVVTDLVEVATIEKNDKVLEIGAGKGVVTKALSEKAEKVIAIEIDESFRKELSKLPGNVEVIFIDALEFLEKKQKFDRIVSSLPSSLVEPLINRLCHFDFEIASFLVPLKFVDNLLNEVFYTAYLETKLIRKVDKEAFSPQPKTNWAIVKIIKKKSPLSVSDFERFLQQYLLNHLDAKVKNALVEALIRIWQSQEKKLTKNQAREIVSEAKIPLEVLENPVGGKEILKIVTLLLPFLKP